MINGGGFSCTVVPFTDASVILGSEVIDPGFTLGSQLGSHLLSGSNHGSGASGIPPRVFFYIQIQY